MSNLSRGLKTMASYGLVRMERGGRKLAPKAVDGFKIAKHADRRITTNSLAKGAGVLARVRISTSQ